MKKILFASIALISLVLFSSCKKDDPLAYFEATGTMKQIQYADHKYFIQQDDHTALIVENSGAYPFKRTEQRVLLGYYLLYKEKVSSFPYDGITEIWNIRPTALDTIYTKNTVLTKGEQDDDLYGTSQIAVAINPAFFPTTLIEDGYLNLCFSVLGYLGSFHIINVVTGTDPEDPYKLVLRHKIVEENSSDVLTSSGEPDDTGIGGYRFNGMINFPLNSLPDTKGETVKVTLSWDSFVSGQTETAEFEYKSRSDWNNAN